MLATVRVQEKGQVTIPSDIRKKMRLKKGDLVTFVLRNNDVVIQPVKIAVQELLADLEQSLEQRGLKLEALLLTCQRAGGERAAREFGLNEDEKTRLYQALQLQAQQALEMIRAHSEHAGIDLLDEAEIDAEIQAVRDEAPNAYRT